MSVLQKQLFELVTRAATDLPEDIETAIRKARDLEQPGSSSRAALETILQNAALARQNKRPICQDTGMLNFFVEAAPALDYFEFKQAAESAIVKATELGILRQNCVETLSGQNTGNNLGYGCPNIHWQAQKTGKSRVSLMLKGGGCENVGIQYSLPDSQLGAGRDLEGVRRCVLDAVWQAQGKGCAPGLLAVCIGADRNGGYEEGKKLLLRKIGERSEQPELAALELRLLEECNALGIGCMGFGGKTSVLEVFLGARCRLPASYFVTVTYMCWCCRRHSIEIEA
ncbi:MAG: fumarate hydratase [Lentisphaeria bacterium]|nr:fumarate hydratase [Lentisphaeria bacterium]MDY0176529.1 fumarate hydratase [Lentisphaeria bacterium]NLZ60052.1 fumarate hydratase [Lentisphaerota bacterium]